MWDLVKDKPEPEQSGIVEADTLAKAKRRACKESLLNFKRVGNYVYGRCPWYRWNDAIHYRSQGDRQALRENQKTLVLIKIEQAAV